MVNFFYLHPDPEVCATYYCDKHVNKIMIEISQILSQIHHTIGTKKPPYAYCTLIKDTMVPYKWAMESKENYLFAAKLALALLNEYKYRYQKDVHSCETAIRWHLNNVPETLKSTGLTPFRFTKNTQDYHDFYPDVLTAAKLSYVDYKCKNDKWTRRGQPKWFPEYQAISTKVKSQALSKIDKIVKQLGFDGEEVVTIALDCMLQGRWQSKIRANPKMFNIDNDMLPQLGAGHILKILQIVESMKDTNTFLKLQQASHSYRKRERKLKLKKL